MGSQPGPKAPVINRTTGSSWRVTRRAESKTVGGRRPLTKSRRALFRTGHMSREAARARRLAFLLRQARQRRWRVGRRGRGRRGGAD